ncbi:MAG TPA: hypothetical protein VFS07_04500, partial [Gemmatimonadales bacterium]|nr:hypothetical protein [Gemmatimonadales bacterium]
CQSAVEMLLQSQQTSRKSTQKIGADLGWNGGVIRAHGEVLAHPIAVSIDSATHHLIRHRLVL